MKDYDPLELAKSLIGYHEDKRTEPQATRVQRGLFVRSLPAWPFVAPLAGILVMWAMGLGLLLWPLVAVCMMSTWVGISGFKVPAGTTLWVFFLAWVCITLTMNDTTGRLVGALVRLSIYISVAVIYNHLHNATRRITLHVITATMTWYLLAMTIGGFLGILAPELRFRTPMAWIIPNSIAHNAVIREMVERRTTQWDPTGWQALDPRPSAPFTYTNQWGNAYSLVLPLVMLNLLVARKIWQRIATFLVVVASMVPAAATQNRGMFLGIGVVLAWVAIQTLRRGRVVPVLVGAMFLGIISAIWVVSPASQALFHRLEVSPSTTDRYELYTLTIESALQSPLIGWGSPRPAPLAWLPSLGTQGQFWLVLQSHGLVGLSLFLSFFIYLFAISIKRTDIVGAVAGGVILATMVETLYYGMTGGLVVTMTAAALISRSTANRIDETTPIAAPASRVRRALRTVTR